MNAASNTGKGDVREPPRRRRAAVAMLVGGYANIGLITIQGFVIVPLTLHAVGANLYGAWLGSGNIIGWLGILELGTASIMIQRIASAYGRGDKVTASDYFWTGLVAQCVLVLIFSASAILVAPYFPAWMGITGTDAQTLQWCFVIAAAANGLSIINNGVAGFAQALQRTLFMNIASFASTCVGFAVTAGMLLTGWGLWSIPIGLTIRNTSLLAANSYHAFILHQSYIAVPVHVSVAVIKDFYGLAGPALMANLGNAAMGKSDVAMVAIIISPAAATVYALTKRAAEVVMMLLDRTGAAVFGGFAHLVGERNRARANLVFHEVIHKQISAAVIMLSTFLAFNQSFVRLWVGEQQFGGALLSELVGAGTVFASVSGTLGYLYGATGKIAQGAYVILVEAIVRFLLMVALLVTVGMMGPPIAAVTTSLVSGLIYYIWTVREVGGQAKFGMRPNRGFVLYVLVLLAGSVIGLFELAVSWVSLCALVSCYVAMAAVAALLVDPMHEDLRQKIHSHVPFLGRAKASLK
jgi:O-antigen/teichoic acid export membrane protein